MQTQLFGNPQKKPTHNIPMQISGKDYYFSDPTAMRGWLTVMDMYAVIGGAACHFGGPSALMEILSTLHGIVFTEAQEQNRNWYDLYHLVNDAGHCENAFYTIKANYEVAGLNFDELKKFRSLESPLTGHGEVHCFPKGVLLSNGPLGSAFPQSQGLAMADKKSGNNRMTITVISDGACMEGEAKECMAAIPGLAQKGLINPFCLIISDNNTKLSGRIDQESFGMKPTFDSLTALGWKVIPLESGHDLRACAEVLIAAMDWARKNPEQPVAIHARTIKGFGTKKTADSSSGAHGFPLKKVSEMKPFLEEIFTGKSIPQEILSSLTDLAAAEAAKKPDDPGEKIQVGISNAMIKAKKNGIPVVSITSDLPGSTGVAGFRKEFPQESFDVGIAESNMVSTAAGFSKMGYVPVVDTFAQFGVTKGALPLMMANLSLAPIIAVYSHTGFQDAADGASHQALSYLGMTCSIPHTKVVVLSSSEEAETLMGQALEDFHSAKSKGENPDSVIFFLGRENFPKTYQAQLKYEMGKSQIVLDAAGSQATAKKVVIYCSGSLVKEGIKAAEELKTKNIYCCVVNASSMSPFDVHTLKSLYEKNGENFITVDDHQTVGGLGSLLSLSAHQLGLKLKLKSLGVDNEFGRSSYTASELYQLHGIDSGSIVKAAHSFF
ncbi:MAG: transketolase C-terminal domain-containing protein [Pseudobdellovibrionaceae bacterium]